jgi:hypothetical protein
MGSNRQESVRLRRDLGGVLEQEAVCRVGIDLHPGIGDEAGQQVAELGRDHQVAVALDHRVGLLIPVSRWSAAWFGMPHSTIASYCASRTVTLVGASRPS